MIKAWIISDTHANHYQLPIPKDIEMVIHCGDSTNYRNWVQNQPEFEDFFIWWNQLNVKYKILIAGNHDTWATKKYNIDRIKETETIYLEHKHCEIEGKLFFGSPYTPTFGDWHFMKDRSKLNNCWGQLEKPVDVLITHGPPMGILDLSLDRNNILEYCGDRALLNHVLRVKPSIHCFGHIHNFKNCINQGIRIYDDIKFINASVVEDGKMEQISSTGIIIDI
jgi:Icc-related predicted phosphoesterase